MSNLTTTDSVEQEFGTGTGEAQVARGLLALNCAPRPALVARVRAVPGTVHVQGGQTVIRGVPRLAWAMIAVALLLSGMVAVSPPLRATLGVITEKIGDLVVSITDRLPTSSETVVYDYTWVTPDQAPFQFGMPQYVPEGWTTDGMIGVNHLRGEGIHDAEVRWTRPDHGHIFMSVWPVVGDEPVQALIGPDSYREITIDGRPAVIIQGGWDSDTGEWSHPQSTTVMWAEGSLQYWLWSSDPEMTEAELVRIAESIP